jgi:protein-arginine kinase activator protein McsA
MNCPECKSRATVRDTKCNLEGAKTRRYHCNTCSNRFTTAEIPIDWLNELRELRYIRTRMQDLLGSSVVVTTLKEPVDEKIKTCQECKHWWKGVCNLEIPEGGTYFANECVVYEDADD